MSFWLRTYSSPGSADYQYPDTGYTVYQGSGRLSSIAGQTRKINNMAGRPENGWHSITGEKKGVAGSQSYQPSSRSEEDDPYEATMGDGPMPGKQSGSPTRGITHLFSVYSDKSSISGVPFIKNTKYSAVRIMWSILLCLAIVAMGLHLYMLFETFFDYQTQSKLDLNFSYLQFPAVTICNVNPVRLSKISYASQDLQDLVESVKTEHLLELLDEWEPSYEDEDIGEDDFDRKRRKRSTNSSTAARQVKVQNRIGGFFDDVGSNSTSWYDEPSGSSIASFTDQGDYEDSWEAESSESSFESITNDFTYLLGLEDSLTRFEMGHQIQDMLVSCSFAGRQCFQSNFTISSSSVHGNCYTLEYNKFTVRRSGPRQGLELMIYLQTDEYIPTISTSKGIQVVIHDQNSLPFPDDEGFGVSAGTNTFVGLRKLEISRKGSPYGTCTSSSDFQTQYGKFYTRQTCQKLCLQQRIRKRCNCYDGVNVVLNRMLKIPKNFSVCDTVEELECVYNVNWNFQTDATGCNCENPCTESQYRKSISFREWPSPAFARVLSKTLCKEDPDLCSTFENKTAQERQSEFLKLTIFFEDLNHELMEETADYEVFQFVSDVGGTVGLWIGLSVLSIFEIFHLGIAVFRYLCCGNWQKKRKRTSAS